MLKTNIYDIKMVMGLSSIGLVRERLDMSIMAVACIALVWAIMSIGVAHFCILSDAWDRSCRDYYMPDALKSKYGYVAMVVLSPIGFFVSVHYVIDMLNSPAPPPEWVQKILRDVYPIR